MHWRNSSAGAPRNAVIQALIDLAAVTFCLFVLCATAASIPVAAFLMFCASF